MAVERWEEEVLLLFDNFFNCNSILNIIFFLKF